MSWGIQKYRWGTVGRWGTFEWGQGLYPIFEAALTTSIVPDIGVVDPTFTRSTIADVTDFEGAIHTALVDESRHTGARIVHNLLDSSEDFGSADWTVQSGVTVDDLGDKVFRINFAGDNLGVFQITSTDIGIGASVLGSIYMKSETVSGEVTIADPKGTSVGFIVNRTVTTDWGRYESGTGVMPSEDKSGLWIRKKSGGLSSVLIKFSQLEKLTGSQVSASEYVSTGVSVNAGVELIRNPTLEDDGLYWSIDNDAGGAVYTAGRNTTSPISGTADYKLAVTTAGTDQSYPRIRVNYTTVGKNLLNKQWYVNFSYKVNSGTCILYIVKNGSNGTSTVVTETLTGSGTYTFLQKSNDSDDDSQNYYHLMFDGRNEFDIQVDNMSVRTEYFHGVNVDGVKCFDTDRSGVPISAAILEGYLGEEESTNIVLQSDDLGTSWGVGSVTLSPNDALAPNGEKTADKIAQVDSINNKADQTITLAAATVHTVSWRIKNFSSTRSRLRIRDNNISDTLAQIVFNWVAGVPSTESSVSATDIRYVEGYNGWWTISFRFTTAAVVTDHGVWLYPEVGATATNSILAHRAQVEAGAKPTSGIKTLTTTVTRTKDDLSYAYAGIIDFAEGTCYAELTYEVPEGVNYFVDTGSDGRLIYSNTAETSEVRAYDGTTIVNIANAPDFQANQLPVATSWGPDGLKISKGGSIDSDVFDGAMQTGNISILRIVERANIRNVRIYGKQLTDSQTGRLVP